MSEKYSYNLCRLCLYKSHNLIDIFGLKGRHGYVAADVIQDLLQIVVHECDGFPQNVCSICLDKLTDFKVFKDQCLECKTSFEQEFQLPSFIPPKQTPIHPQESVCMDAIKVEVNVESEIIEIPAEDIVKREFSPVPSELDVETVDDEDDVLYLDSREMTDVPLPTVTPVPHKTSADTADADNQATRNHKGRFLKSKKKKSQDGKKASAASGSPAVRKAAHTSSVPTKETLSPAPKGFNQPHKGESKGAYGKAVRSEDHNAGGTPKTKRLALGQNSETPGAMKGHADILQGLLNRVREETLGDFQPWDPACTVGNSTEPRVFGSERKKNLVKSTNEETKQQAKNSEEHTVHATLSSVSPHFCSPANIIEKVHRTSVDSEGSRSEQSTLRRRNTHPYSYNEDNFLLSGEKIHGYMEWRRWSPERVRKRRKPDAKQRRDIAKKPSPSKKPKSVMQSSIAQRFNDGGSVGLDRLRDGIEQSCDGPMQNHYVCHVCGMSFSTKASCANHRKTHPKMPFACDRCDKTFFTLLKLNTHKFQHSGIRPFGCNICSKAFTRLAHLKRHLQIHTRQSESS